VDSFLAFGVTEPASLVALHEPGQRKPVALGTTLQRPCLPRPGATPPEIAEAMNCV
jgi:hypothetical protein